MAERGRKHFKTRGNKSSRGMSDSSDGGRRVRHPPGLKGKEIGMWYAKRNQGHKKEQMLPVVAMKHDTEQEIAKMLSGIETSSYSKSELEVDGPSTSMDGNSKPAFDKTGKLESHRSNFCERYLNHIDDSKLHDMGKTVDFDPETNGLAQDHALDERLKQDFKRKQADFAYQRMQDYRRKLPSFATKEEIVSVIKRNNVVVISGETGCGKTTQVPQFILDDYIQEGKGSLCSIVCTQPRRISAISVAERVAQERAELCGRDSVGYQIRLENKLPRVRGSILFCTTGIVLKWLESDEYLGRATHIIIDEVHERDLLTDFLIIIVKRILRRRPNLHVILMSASLNAKQFSKYFDNCPTLNIPGFTHPVEEVFLEDILEMTEYRSRPNPRDKKTQRWKRSKNSSSTEEQEMFDAFIRNLSPRKYSKHTVDYLCNMDEKNIDLDLVTALIRHLCFQKDDGAILVFLPGWDTISKVHSILSSQTYFQSRKHLIIPLHSLMPTMNQREVFNRPAPGVRKIILATNIAETSITIDDVIYVINCGKIKLKRFDGENNIATLQPEWISRANAQQRRGRAGRVQPGICYHLYTSLRHNLLDQYQLPEMLRTRLEELCLQVRLLNLGKIGPFLSESMEPPSVDTVNISVEFLQTLNALDSSENLTPLGYHLAHLPVDPQTGKMILFGAIFSCLDPITTIAASLSFKDAFVIPLGKEMEADECRRKLARGMKSDHLMLVKAFEGWIKAKQERRERQYCWDNYLSSNTLQMLANMKKQFLTYLKELHFINVNDVKHPDLNRNSGNVKLVLAMICAGLYPNVARIKKPISKQPIRRRPVGTMTKLEKNATLHPKSVNEREPHFESPWLVFHQKMKSTGVYLHDTSMVSPYPLLFFGGKLLIDTTGQRSSITMDNWIKFACPSQRALLIERLRQELDTYLEYKILHPSPTTWDSNGKEAILLRAITDLITSEEVLNYESTTMDEEECDDNEDDPVT